MARLASLWRNLVRRRRVERDLEEELRATFELLVEEKVRAGLQLDDARRAARLELGSLESLKDEVRDARAGAFVDTLLQDVRYALRLFRRAPGFTVVAVVTLALGIGANTAMFSVVDAVLLRPLPYDEPGRVAQVFEAAAPGQRNYVSVGVFSDWVRHNSTFEALAAVGNAELNLTDGGEPERISGLRMSPSGLLVLRARPVLGRTFAPDEDQPGKSTVIVLTHALWRRRFGGDPGVVGRSVRLNGESHTVIGVLPPSFLPWEEREFVVPMVFKPEQLENRGGHWIRVLGRLRPGVSLARAGEDLLAVSRPYRELYPKWKKDWGVTVVPMHEQLTADVKPMLMVLLGAVALVLLIACANVANLLLARASARQKEIAIRLAIGASRGRVVRQLLAESLLLALIGAAGGLALAFAATAAIRQAGVPNLARTHEIAVDWRVLGFAIVVSLVTGLVFGLAPALQASRPDLNGALVDGGRASTGGRNRTRHSLIVSEVALALVLLAGAGLLVNSFARLLNVNPGFEPRRALALQVSLSERKYPDAEQQTRVTERMPRAHPLAARNRRRRGHDDASVDLAAGHADHDPGPAGATRRELLVRLRLRRSRVLPCAGDTAFPGPPVRRARHGGRGARRPRERDLRSHAFPGDQWQIVGVVGDIRLRGLADRIRPLIYRPLAFARFTNRTLVVRTAGAPRALVEPIRRAILAEDPEQPIANARSIEEVIAASVAQRRLVLVVLALFAASAMLLAAVGLYGVIAYAVSQRTREIGVRMAVGASGREVLALFLRQGLRLTGLGIALGLAGALGLTRLLASQLYGVRATDPATFASVSGVLLLVALVASFLPARRAARVEPMNALR